MGYQKSKCLSKPVTQISTEMSKYNYRADRQKVRQTDRQTCSNKIFHVTKQIGLY